MSPYIYILSATVAVVTLVLAIFGASWLNQRQTEKLLEQFEKRFDARFDSLEKRFDARFESVEHRLDRIERQLEAIFKPILPPHT